VDWTIVVKKVDEATRKTRQEQRSAVLETKAKAKEAAE
jgi:hypothetical protein